MRRFALILLALCPADAASEWGRFRGPNGSGIATGPGVPVEFGPEQNMLWRSEVPAGHSSPVAGGGRVFLTAHESGRLLTIAFSAESGKVLWRREAPRARTSKRAAADTTASPSPVTDGTNVYVFFDDFGLISYGRDGEERWRVPLGPFNTPYGMGASPILAGGKVIVLCDQDTGSFLMAIDEKTGRTVWKTMRPEAIHSFATPILYRPKQGGEQIVVSGAYEVAGYSLERGEKLWWLGGMAWQAKSTPVLDGDVLHVHSWMASPVELGQKQNLVDPFEQVVAERDADRDGKLSPEEVPDPEFKKLWFLLDLDKDSKLDVREWNIQRARGTAGNGLFAIRLGGRGDLTGSAILWRYQKSLPNIPSPLLDRKLIYLLREGGILTALDSKTGSVVKQGRVEGAIDPYFASPILVDGKMILASQTGKVAIVQPGADWHVLKVNDLGEEIWATPAVFEGRLIVRTVKALYCFGRKDRADEIRTDTGKR
jgi:outer membrane protein assembly factor BamB